MMRNGVLQVSYIVWCLIMLCVSSVPAWAGEVPVLALSYGNEPDQVQFFNKKNQPGNQEPSALGPLAFRVVGQEFWVLDSVGGRVLQVVGGKVVARLVVPPVAGHALLQDLALVRDAAGKVTAVWVIDGTANRLVKMSLDGKVAQVIDGKGAKPGRLAQPQRLEVDAAGRLYVADVARRLIVVFAAGGEMLRERAWEWSGLCLDGAGHLCVLQWDPAAKVTHLVRETFDGKPVSDVALALPDHFNPRLLFMTGDDEPVLTFEPATGTQASPVLARCDSKGKPTTTAVVVPRAMNRYLEPGTGRQAWLASADHEAAPTGKFAVGGHTLP